MKDKGLSHVILAFVAAVIVTTLWGSIVQTQYNLGALGAMGIEITAGLRAGTTLRDIFSGFSPTYGGYVVVPALLVAFVAAWFVASRTHGHALLWFALAGVLAIAIGIPVVNELSPVALLVGATRDVSCIILMALGGGLGGLLFGRLTWPGKSGAAGARTRRSRTRVAASAPSGR